MGGSTYFAFYCIFINKFFKNLPGGVLLHTPLCASMLPSAPQNCKIINYVKVFFLIFDLYNTVLVCYINIFGGLSVPQTKILGLVVPQGEKGLEPLGL